MRPAKFSYFAPASLAEVVTLLARYGDDARPLAGGQSLVPLLNMRIARPATLVDLNRCSELDYIREDAGMLAIGAMCRQGAAERSVLVKTHAPLLAKALRYLGPTTTKNRGTIGGSIAHADPVAELPGVALALGAELVVEGPNGTRVISPEDFFVAQLTTAIEPGELLREVRFPKASPNTRAGFVEVSSRKEGLALAGVAAHLVLDGEICRQASLAAIGVGAGPVRLASVEVALAGCALSDATIDEAAALAVNDVDPTGDIHASAAYRRHVTATLTGRALRQALGR